MEFWTQVLHFSKDRSGQTSCSVKHGKYWAPLNDLFRSGTIGFRDPRPAQRKKKNHENPAPWSICMGAVHRHLALSYLKVMRASSLVKVVPNVTGPTKTDSRSSNSFRDSISETLLCVDAKRPLRRNPQSAYTPDHDTQQRSISGADWNDPGNNFAGGRIRRRRICRCARSNSGDEIVDIFHLCLRGSEHGAVSVRV